MKITSSKIIDKILEYEWVMLLLIAYPMLFPKPGMTPVMLVIPILWILHWIREGKALPITPLNLPILLLSIMLLVSLWATFSIEFSLSKISGMIFALGVFFATIRYSLKSIQKVLIFYLVCGLAVSGLGLLATNWPSKIHILSDFIERLPHVITNLPAAESGIHPNELGGILLLFALPSIWLAWRSSRKGLPQQKSLVVVLWLIAAWFSGLLFLTQSRSALLGFAGAVAFFLLASGGWGRVALAISTTALLTFIVVMGPDELLYFPGLDVSGSATFGQVSISDRLEIWSRAVYALQDFAFTGMGMGTFRVIAPLFYPFFFIEPTRDIAHAHNLFLQSGLDLGILGLVSISSIWITISPLIAGSSKIEGQTLVYHRLSVRDLAIGLGGGLVGFSIFSLVDAVALGARPGFLIWMLLGLCVSFYIIVHREGRFQKQRTIGRHFAPLDHTIDKSVNG